MGEAVDSSGFFEAMELVRERRPLGYEYLLNNESELQSAYQSAVDEGPDSPYFRSFDQLDAAGVYAALVAVAGHSARLGEFRRPCCSDWPLTWPICNRHC